MMDQTRPTAEGYEAEARAAAADADREGAQGTSLEFAMVAALRAQTMATLAVSARLEELGQEVAGVAAAIDFDAGRSR